MSRVWINGAEGALDPGDRGLAYGDGVFATVRVLAGLPVLWQRQRQRLQDSCARLQIPLGLPELDAELTGFLQGRGHGVVKIIITRGPGGRGYLPPVPAQPTRLLAWHPLPAYPPAFAELGINAGICQQRLGLSPLLAGIKHLNRLEQVLLRQELEPEGWAEALVLDLQGRVVEGVFSNVFIVSDGVLLTPLLDQAGVAGVMRAELLACAAVLGLEVRIQELSLDTCLSASELFFCNSVYGVWPVHTLAGRVFGGAGVLTRQLQQAIKPLFE